MKCKGLSLFANVGISEVYLEEVGIQMMVANELLEERAKFYKHLYPNTEMIIGDITDSKIYDEIIDKCRTYEVDFIIATPPCQGMSLAGKMDPKDIRNQLIFYAIKAIKDIKPKYILLENVPQQLRTKVIVDGQEILIPEYLNNVLGDDYIFAEQSIVSARDYSVPQMRKRNIVILTRKDMKYIWQMPKAHSKEITLEEAFSGIPSIDPMLREGMDETIKMFPEFEAKKKRGIEFSKWHYPPVHSKKLVKIMQHTPSGCTAFDNIIYYPKRNDGVRVNGHYNTYRRYSWEKPCRTITQNSAVISSLCCVHPGRLLNAEYSNEEERIYSDPRCLTIYELLIVTSLPTNWDIPDWASDKLIRAVIGEGIPPLLVKNIVKELYDNIIN